MPGYYDGLSGESSSSDGSESEQDEHFTADQLLRQPPSRCDRSSHEEDHHRCIVHVDVDCFYCQCEMIDRNLPEDRPLAIGQKHIIVTCNYAARRLGVQKLELRDKAYAKCPSLLILEGSDLTRYRIHARKIYEAFRKACKNIMPSLPVCKGSMDEMMADLTLACQSGTWLDTPPQRDLPIYVYGDQDQEEIVLTEDQTGASVTVREKIASRSPDNEHHRELSAKLRRATTLATRIRESILQETGFRVTCGVSTNPLLSKLASGLRKPGTVNLLYPWRAAQLLENMPIRKLNGVGHQTLKLLRPCLLRHFPGRREPIIWLCRDLRAVPERYIAACLEPLPYRESSEEQARILLQKCQGLDTTRVEDDSGGLAKTVSVENSFRRGTVITQKGVLESAKDVCRRLPDLVQERVSLSHNPDSAYPTTLRLTVRMVDQLSASPPLARDERRRPFETTSKQTGLDGKCLMALDDHEKISYLYRRVSPLLKALILDQPCYDLTRLNLAVANFHDLVGQPPKITPKGSGRRMDAGVDLRGADIDPTVLDELPPYVAAEVRREFMPKTLKKRRINEFFTVKPKRKFKG